MDDLLFDTMMDHHRSSGRTGGLDDISFDQIEEWFGTPSWLGSGDDKVDFEWNIQIEGEIMVSIWNYKNHTPVNDSSAKTWWSVGGSKLGMKFLSQITGWTVTN